MAYYGWYTPPTGFASSVRTPSPVLASERLMQSREATGSFWHPETPDERYWGTIAFDPGNATRLVLEGNLLEKSGLSFKISEQSLENLNLEDVPNDILEKLKGIKDREVRGKEKFLTILENTIGEEATVQYKSSLLKYAKSGIRLSDEVPVLHGQFSNGAPCSLFSCWCNVDDFYVRDRQYFRTHVFSPLLIFGGHWSEADACRFDRLQVRFSHLDQWFENPYTIHHKRGGFTKSLLTFKPDTLNADFVFKGVNVHLKNDCVCSIPTVATPPEGARWSYQYHLILQPESPQPIEWLLELTTVLREFFVFFLGSGVYTLDLVGISGAVEDNNFQRFEVDRPVTVPAVVQTESRYFSTHHRDYKEALPSILRAWFDRRTALEIAARAYTELLCTDGMSPETILLRTVETLGHFHGALWPEESPRLPLRAKLKKVFGEIPGRTRMPMLDNPRNSEEYLETFLNRVTDTRNYLTHFNEKMRKKSFQGDELEDAALICWATLTFWIAQHLGIDEEHAGDMALAAKNAMFLVSLQNRL